MADLLTFGASVVEFTAPTDDRLETTDRLRVSVSGPESNAAVAAGRLGVESAWLSKLPKTSLGRRVANEVGRHGVETAIHWSETGRQGLTFGERAGPPRGNSRLDDRNGAAVASAVPGELPLSAVRDASTVYTSGATATLSTTLAETTAALLESVGEAGATTVLGLGRPRAFESPTTREAVVSLFPQVDVLLTTEAGATALGQGTNPTETVHALASTHDFETVVLAREERGALVWHDRTVHEHAPPETDTVDDRGAFDALCGAFLARRLDGDDVGRALAAGVACGALARTVRGPLATITPEEVERCIERME